MKPKPALAMQELINYIRQGIPFDTPESSLCIGPCQGCSKKLIKFLDDQVCDWSIKLEQGIAPKLGDINKLAHIAIKVRKVLTINGFIEANSIA